MNRRLPFVMMAATVTLGGYLLASYANDLAQMSLRAYGTRAQSVLGGPVIWTAAQFPQMKALAMLLPGVIVAAWWMRRLSDLTCLIYLSSWAFIVVTWSISVAYFSVQPGVLG